MFLFWVFSVICAFVSYGFGSWLCLLSVHLYKRYVYRHFAFSLSFSLNLYRVCTAVSFSIKDIYMYRLFVFSSSFSLDICSVCTGASFPRFFFFYRHFVFSPSISLDIYIYPECAQQFPILFKIKCTDILFCFLFPSF